MKHLTCLAFLLLLFLAACDSMHTIQDTLSHATPYEKYARGLEKAQLHTTLLGKKWIDAGNKALKDSITVSLPFSESGYFSSNDPSARSYVFSAQEGQVITANSTVVAKDNPRLFMDLFAWRNEKWISLAHGDSTLNLTHEFRGVQQQYLLRIQPELLATVYYTFNITLTPVLINPVAGASNKSIGSFYGDERDGGRRSHEGVDIFAKKGTPVIAPTDGYVSRVGTGKLGGKYVWLIDGKRGNAYYFAHLDEQLVTAGTKVKQGHALGTVGNTGNARYTPAHLHFGIYQRGSKDPIHFIKTMEALAVASPWDSTLTEREFKIKVKKSLLRSGPSGKSKEVASLASGAYVKVVAQTNNYFRVIMPDDIQGFVSKTQVQRIEKGKSEKLTSSRVLLSETHPQSAPLAMLEPEMTVEVLAHHNEYSYVRTSQGIQGWMKK